MRDNWRIIYIVSLVILGGLIMLSTYNFFVPEAGFTKLQRMQLLEGEDERIIQFNIINLEKKDMDYRIEIKVDERNFNEVIHVKNGASFTYIQHLYENLNVERVNILIYREGEETPFEEAAYYIN